MDKELNILPEVRQKVDDGLLPSCQVALAYEGEADLPRACSHRRAAVSLGSSCRILPAAAFLGFTKVFSPASRAR